MQLYTDISKHVYIYKKINDIFLTFHHFLLSMPKIIEIGCMVKKNWPLAVLCKLCDRVWVILYIYISRYNNESIYLGTKIKLSLGTAWSPANKI